MDPVTARVAHKMGFDAAAFGHECHKKDDGMNRTSALWANEWYQTFHAVCWTGKIFSQTKLTATYRVGTVKGFKYPRIDPRSWTWRRAQCVDGNCNVPEEAQAAAGAMYDHIIKTTNSDNDFTPTWFVDLYGSRARKHASSRRRYSKPGKSLLARPVFTLRTSKLSAQMRSNCKIYAEEEEALECQTRLSRRSKACSKPPCSSQVCVPHVVKCHDKKTFSSIFTQPNPDLPCGKDSLGGAGAIPDGKCKTAFANRAQIFH